MIVSLILESQCLSPPDWIPHGNSQIRAQQILQSEPNVVFKMIAQPVLLTWEELDAMPELDSTPRFDLYQRKHAWKKQIDPRSYTFRNNIDEIDLSGSLEFNWRLLLKTVYCLNTPDMIGPGIVGFSFRFLSEIDPNYAAERHVFELTCANGDRWHLHFHQRGNCHRRYLPWSTATEESEHYAWGPQLLQSTHTS